MFMITFLQRMYMQFIILIAIAVFFAYVLNFIFAIEDNELRIMLSSIFLACFSVAIIIFKKI
jgi:hypothetical protein